MAAAMDIDLMPWQETAGRYLEAKAPDGRHLYREVAVIVARQNGKTELLLPLIIKRLLAGARIIHTAQDRSLPREVFYRAAEWMWSTHPELFPLRNGRPTKPRYANGQEEMRLTNGSIYSIVAPTRSGARGKTSDLVVLDELRELETWDFIAAAKATMTVSRDPQMVYLSNAGTEDSTVLNALRLRGGTDPSLAYLEWSADPARRADDPKGWAEANPAMGNERGEMGSVLETMTAEYRTAMLEGTLSTFETEHLCRWVATMRERLVDDYSWSRCRGEVGPPSRPALGIATDPKGTRVSVAMAWQEGDDIALRLLLNVTGSPVDLPALGLELQKLARKNGVRSIGFDPLTDKELAKYFARGLPGGKKPDPISGQTWANASARFRSIVDASKLRWSDCDPVTDDLTWTASKPNGEGSYHAVRASDERPITASLAAIRAVWLASGPPVPVARVL
jgi:hypothetical protein